jgi:fucose permease
MTTLTTLPKTGYLSMDDALLAQQARTDPQAFAELYRRHVRCIYGYHLAHTGEVRDAEDLTSQTFMAALEGIHSFRGTGPYITWLIGIASRKRALFFRRRGNKPDVSSEVFINSEARYNSRSTPKRKHHMHQTFHRDRFTWLTYFSLAFYGYFLNVLGPITPFLKDELQLTYTVSSFHFTAFAVGILLIGLGGHLIIQRIGRRASLWVGMAGISLSTLLLLAGRNPVITIGACFLMGLVGSLVLAIVPAALSDQHGEQRAVANVIASLLATSAPLMVGWFARSFDSWRLPLGIMALVPLPLFVGFRNVTAFQNTSFSEGDMSSSRPLPPLFWIYWVGIVLGVSVEFCMILWSADYLEQVLGLIKADAVQAVSLFLAAMILGRLLGSRLVQRFSTRSVIAISIVIASIGFLLFWRTENIFLSLSGLFLTGLGVANFYPLILSLAIGAAKENTVQAGARATLASGTAILALPLALGRLADALGIRLAYGVVLVLLISIFLISLFSRGTPSSDTIG